MTPARTPAAGRAGDGPRGELGSVDMDGRVVAEKGGGDKWSGVQGGGPSSVQVARADRRTQASPGTPVPRPDESGWTSSGGDTGGAMSNPRKTVCTQRLG